MDAKENLNLPDFWDLPEKDWKNIIKYNYRYLVTINCASSKEEAHRAYSCDIRHMLRKETVNSSRWKTLKSCEETVKAARKNKANQYFWENEAEKIAALITKEWAVDKELEVLEKVTAATALKGFNQRAIRSSSSSSGSNSRGNNPSDGRNQPKRKYDENEHQTPSKRPNQPQTLAEKFASFKKAAIIESSTSNGLSLESGIQELMALSDVMLLKPSQFTNFARRHFGDDVLREWHAKTVENLLGGRDVNCRSTSNDIADIIYDLQKEDIKVRGAVQRLVDLSKDKEDGEAQMLLGISNLIQKLPFKTLLGTAAMGETELWSRVFDPVLSALFTDPNRDVILRWTNIVPEKGSASDVIRVQPDAIVCKIDQLNLGHSLGHGEAKLADAHPNIIALATDLLRLAVMNSKALEESKMEAAIAFQIHGWNLKLYMMQNIPGSNFKTMTELESITFPRSIQDLDAFITRKNIEALVRIYEAFWSKCTQKRNGEGNEEDKEQPTSPRFDITTIQAIKEGGADRTRECPIRY